MKYWRINTDRNARGDVRTCDLWYEFGALFAGDFDGNERKHDRFLHLILPGDGIFMHDSGLGIVGYGAAKETWDGQTHRESQRQLYVKEDCEYRLTVDWDPTYDRRTNPLPISGRLPYAGTCSRTNPERWDVQTVLQDLRKQAPAKKKVTSAGSSDPTAHTEIQKPVEIADVEAKILSCIGKAVSFKYPGKEGDKHGVLKDRSVTASVNEPGSVPYWDVVDLIEFKEEQEKEWIRIGYYRKPGSTVNWGSQTTITEPVRVWKKMLVNAARDKKWFGDLLNDVLNELKSS